MISFGDKGDMISLGYKGEGRTHILMMSFLCVSRRDSHDAPKSPKALLSCVGVGMVYVHIEDVCRRGMWV